VDDQEAMNPEYIILHHSLTSDGDTVSWGAIRRYHVVELGWRDIGYHYGIERVNGTYEVLMGRMPTEPGAHCKQSGMNYKSLGVCLIGNFDEAPPTPAQWRKAVQLVRALMQVHKIPVERVLPHNYLAHYKTCPGKMFDMERFCMALEKGQY